MAGVNLVLFGAAVLILRPFPANADANHPAFAVISMLLGIALFVVSWRTYRKSVARWDAYSMAARAFAKSYQQDNVVGEPPRRPLFVVGALEDFRTSAALDERSIEDVTNRKLPGVIQKLLRSCGEDALLLGTSRVEVSPPNSNRAAEWLEPIWIIDRVWKDGRKSTEWIYIGKCGDRLRIAVGARAEGILDWRITNRVQRFVQMGKGILGTALFCFACPTFIVGQWLSQLGAANANPRAEDTTMAAAGMMGVVVFTCVAVYNMVASLLVPMGLCKAALPKLIPELTDPLSMFRTGTLPSDELAARERVLDTLLEIEPMRTR